nr:F-box domain-containing protein [Cedratvirus duvanny]
MQDLPEELQEKVLLSIRKPQDLYRACSTSRQSRGICSGSVFWRAKFTREGLPLLEQGENFTSWLGIYRKSMESAQVADEMINSKQEIVIPLEDLPDLSLLQVPGYERRLEQLWQDTKTGANQTTIIHQSRFYDEEETVTKHIKDYFVYLLPSDNFYTFAVVEERNSTVRNGKTKSSSKTLYTSRPITKDDAWVTIYRLTYFGFI